MLVSLLPWSWDLWETDSVRVKGFSLTKGPKTLGPTVHYTTLVRPVERVQASYPLDTIKTVTK